MDDGTVADVFYNGVTLDEMRSQYGLLQLGVEKIKPYFTRGILIDVAGYRGVEILPNEYEVTVSDVRGALAAQEMDEDDIESGDALFFNFGWASLWGDPQRILRDWERRPDVGQEVLDWIVDRRPSLIGWEAGTGGAGHAQLTLMNGIPSLEFMNFEELLSEHKAGLDIHFALPRAQVKNNEGSEWAALAPHVLVAPDERNPKVGHTRIRVTGLLGGRAASP